MQGDRSVFGGQGRRARLLAGAALLVCAPLSLASQSAAQTQDVQPAPVLAAQERPTDSVYIEAGSASREGDVITATGTDERALARFQSRTLRADQLSYDLERGVATADGDIELTTDTGDVVTASHIELDSDLRAGVAVDFATRLSNGASLMAATAVRRSPQVNELNFALFTPCPICDDEGNPKTPSLSVQAEKIIQDEELRAILYRNAVFKVGGVPVFWLPVFAHPDPTVERASGFLIPRLTYDEGRGVSLETPYLFVVSPSEDWLISPQFNSEVTPFLNGQWRRRFTDGTVVARFGYTYARDFDGDADASVAFDDKRTSRSYLLAHGRFDPEGPWRWGFTAERTSDKTLFDRYDVPSPYQDNGLYYGDQRRLISQLYAERQTERSYLSVAAFALQSLRLDPRFSATDFRDPVTGLKVFEDDDTLPMAAPIIDARWEPEGPVLGGRLRLKGSAASLYRQEFFGSPILRPEAIPADTTGLSGVDSRRVTLQGEWRRAVILPVGIRFEPFVDTRLDIYSISDLPPGMQDGSDAITRGRATAGLDVSYPLIKRLGADANLILEPLAQVSISSQSDLDPRIPIEDTQTFELDESSLFRIDRLPGYDLYEGGARFTAGARATLRWDQSRSASLFVGRSYREDSESAFRIAIPDAPGQVYDPSGLASRTSDWVVQGDFTPSDRIRGWGHATVDGDGEIRRAEASIDGRWGRRNQASLSYIIDRSNPVDGPLNRNYQFVQLAGHQFVLGHWGVSAAGIADLEENVITRSEIGLLFDDDCFRFEIGYRRDNTRVRTTGASEGVYVRLNLATFGGSGYD